jgi:hypothetical protein
MRRAALEVVLAMAAVVGFLMYGCSERRAGAIAMQLHVADSVGKANSAQLERVRSTHTELVARADRAVARADVAEAARHAMAERLERVSDQREHARAELVAAGSPVDSIAALLAKSAADDSLIAEQRRVIDAAEREARELRDAVVMLHTAADSAAAQLRRDAAVEAQLRAAIRTARPSVTRTWVERVVSGVVGYAIGKKAR